MSSRSDDSTFLSYADFDFGNTLLLPNRNLASGYQVIGLTANDRINRHVSIYTVMDNLLSQHYQEVFGYPSLPFTFRAGAQFVWGGDPAH